MILLFILYIAIPIIFLFQLWQNKNSELEKWLLDTALYGTYILVFFFTGGWALTFGYFTRYLLIVAFFLVSIKSFYNTKRSFSQKSTLFRPYISNTIKSMTVGLFVFMLIETHDSSIPTTQPVELEFPLKGDDFCVVHGGSGEITNHHSSVPAQKYALDIVQLNSFGFRAQKLSPKNLNDFIIFGSVVYSPCDGTVIEAIGQFEDQELMTMNPDNPVGNYVAIAKKNSDVVIILGHFKKESIRVKKGEVLQKGQPIALVGNSGNTTEPHLHIHAMKNFTGDFIFTGEGVPMTFNKRFLIRNDRAP